MVNSKTDSFFSDLTENLMSDYGFNRATAAAIVQRAADELVGYDDDIACYAGNLAQFVHTILEFN